MTWENGNYIQPNYYSHRFRKILKKLNFNKPVRFIPPSGFAEDGFLYKTGIPSIRKNLKLVHQPDSQQLLELDPRTSGFQSSVPVLVDLYFHIVVIL